MIDVEAIRPLAEDGETVLLSRADYEALKRQAEDAADAAQMREAEARVTAGEDEFVPSEVTRRLMATGARLARAPWSQRPRAGKPGLRVGRLSKPDRDRQ